MNIKEFAALKPGDKIENPMSGSRGEVTSVNDSGVRITWSPGSAPFFYSVNTTAWMNWAKAPATEKCQAVPMDNRDGWLKCDRCGSVWMTAEGAAKPSRCFERTA